MGVKGLSHFFLNIGRYGAVIDDMAGLDPVPVLEISVQMMDDRELFHMKLSGDIFDRYTVMIQPDHLNMAFFFWNAFCDSESMGLSFRYI